MTVNPDLYRASSDAETWKRLAAEMNAEFQLVDLDAARRKPSDTLTEKDAEAERQKAIEPAKKALQQAIYAQWGGYRMHYTLGQLDTDVLLLLAEQRMIAWQEIFNAKASFGTADDLVKIQKQALLVGSSVTVNNALSSAAKPFLIVNGLRHEGNPATTEQLFKMGADPAYDNNGALFNAVVDAGRADIGRLFAKYGQNGLLNIDPWINAAKSNRKFKLYEDLRKIQWDYGRFTVIDNETLLETKPLPEAGTLRILFNFGARRVTEFYEITNPSKQTITKDYAFDDYGQNALETAHDKLIELGANPSGVELHLRGKPVVAKPAARGLSDRP